MLFLGSFPGKMPHFPPRWRFVVEKVAERAVWFEKYHKSWKIGLLRYNRGSKISRMLWNSHFMIRETCENITNSLKFAFYDTEDMRKYHKLPEIRILWYGRHAKISQTPRNSHFMIREREKNIIKASILEIYDIEGLQKYHKSWKTGVLWYKHENISNVVNSTLLRYRRTLKYLKSLKNHHFEILARRKISQISKNWLF